MPLWSPWISLLDVPRPPIFYIDMKNYIDIGNESIYNRIKVLIKFVYILFLQFETIS